jgi:aspartyl protease family protein
MMRLMVILILLTATGGAVLAYGDPTNIETARHMVTRVLRGSSTPAMRSAEIPRGNAGDFAVRAKINGVSTPMVIDTGATWVVLTYETAKAAGLPLELLEYDVDVETASGHTRAARLTLDRLAIGGLIERSVPSLVVPRGSMKTNLLGMSFLDRLESWEVRADRLMLRGYP